METSVQRMQQAWAYTTDFAQVFRRKIWAEVSHRADQTQLPSSPWPLHFRHQTSFGDLLKHRNNTIGALSGNLSPPFKRTTINPPKSGWATTVTLCVRYRGDAREEAGDESLAIKLSAIHLLCIPNLQHTGAQLPVFSQFLQNLLEILAENSSSVHLPHPRAAQDKMKQRLPLSSDLCCPVGQNLISTLASHLCTHIHQGPIWGKTTQKNEFYIMTCEGEKKGSWTYYN